MSATTIAAPFASAADAWFWAVRALSNRRAGVLPDRPGCDPQDVVRALDRLRYQRRISWDQVFILSRWGEAGAIPSTKHPARVQWDDAMSALAYALRQAGIVA